MGKRKKRIKRIEKVNEPSHWNKNFELDNQSLNQIKKHGKK